MRKLDADELVLRMREFGDLAERLDLRVLPDTGIFGCDTSFGNDGGRFNEGETRSALDDATKMGEVPWRVVAIFRRVLAEWGELEIDM